MNTRGTNCKIAPPIPDPIKRTSLEVFKKILEAEIDLTFVSGISAIYDEKLNTSSSRTADLKKIEESLEELKDKYNIAKKQQQTEFNHLYRNSLIITKQIYLIKHAFFKFLLKELKQAHAQYPNETSVESYEKIITIHKEHYDNVANALQPLGKNLSQDDDHQIRYILNKYIRLHLTPLTSEINQLVKSISKTHHINEVIASLKAGRRFFLDMASHSSNFDAWLEKEVVYKKLIDTYAKRFRTEFGNDQEIQDAFNKLFKNKNHRPLKGLLTDNQNYLDFFTKRLPTLIPVIEAWYKARENQTEIDSTLMRLESIKAELAKGLGKVHGEGYKFPCIEQFNSDSEDDINNALSVAIAGLKSRLKFIKPTLRQSFNLFNINNETSHYTHEFKIEKEWIYFKLLDEYLRLQEKAAPKDISSHSLAYEKHCRELKAIENKYFSGFREQESEEKKQRKQLGHLT